jgi:hypothetical protein
MGPRRRSLRLRKPPVRGFRCGMLMLPAAATQQNHRALAQAAVQGFQNAQRLAVRRLKALLQVRRHPQARRQRGLQRGLSLAHRFAKHPRLAAALRPIAPAGLPHAPCCSGGARWLPARPTSGAACRPLHSSLLERVRARASLPAPSSLASAGAVSSICNCLSKASTARVNQGACCGTACSKSASNQCRCAATATRPRRTHHPPAHRHAQQEAVVKACSASSTGTSLLAATTLSSGVGERPLPLSNSRSLSSVSSALRMAELALKTSSRKAMPAVGRKPWIRRS